MCCPSFIGVFVSHVPKLHDAKVFSRGEKGCGGLMWRLRVRRLPRFHISLGVRTGTLRTVGADLPWCGIRRAL